MTKRILVLCSLLTALAGCAAEERTAPVDTALDQRCIAMASTGDMYRYCMEVGEQQALLESPRP